MNKRPAAEVIVSGIKCDTPTCDYKDMTVKLEDYDQWINKPCPKCGANLLTQDDVDALNAIIKLTNLVSSMVPDELNVGPRFTQAMSLNGTGNVVFGEFKVSNPEEPDKE